MAICFYNKRALRKHLIIAGPREQKPVTNFQVLRDDPQLREELTTKLEQKLAGILTDDINALNNQIASTVRTSMEEVCPQLDPIRKKEPWEDVELIRQMQRLRKLSKHEDVLKMQKTIKKRKQKLKNEYYQQLADSINNAAAAREVEKEFAMAKKYTAIRTGSKRAISNVKLKTHFEQHFAEKEPAARSC